MDALLFTDESFLFTDLFSSLLGLIIKCIAGLKL